MMSKIEISFILPIYNVEKYLPAAIESILKQDISKEIILVDDGSTDSSLAIAIDYAKKYSFIYVIHSKNKGVSSARNAGLRLAKGEFVMFVDADDTLNKNLDLLKICRYLNEYNCSVGKGLFKITLLNEKNFLFSPVNSEVLQGNIVVTHTLKFALHSLPDNWFMHIGSFIIKRKMIMSHKITFNESLTIGEDIIFLLDLFSINEKVVEFPFIFYNYNKREGSLTTQRVTKDTLLRKQDFLQCLKPYLTSEHHLRSYVEKVHEIHVKDYENDFIYINQIVAN